MMQPSGHSDRAFQESQVMPDRIGRATPYGVELLMRAYNLSTGTGSTARVH